MPKYFNNSKQIMHIELTSQQKHYHSSSIVWAWKAGFDYVSRVLAGAAYEGFVALGICSSFTCVNASKFIHCLPELKALRAGHVMTSAFDACIKVPCVVLHNAQFECRAYR